MLPIIRDVTCILSVITHIQRYRVKLEHRKAMLIVEVRGNRIGLLRVFPTGPLAAVAKKRDAPLAYK